jgi:hypothetical protein
MVTPCQELLNTDYALDFDDPVPVKEEIEEDGQSPVHSQRC